MLFMYKDVLYVFLGFVLTETSDSKSTEPGNSDSSIPRLLRISTYQPYFNVDTREVSDRIMQSSFVNRGDFMQLTSHNPDL